MKNFGEKDIDSLFREFREIDREPEEKGMFDYIGEYQPQEEDESQLDKPRKRGRPRKNRR